MNPPVRTWYAPVLDAAAIVSFIVVGRGRHEIDEGLDWFLTVAWPLFLGWAIVAVLTKLYTRTDGIWFALLITLAAGIAVAAVFRGTFTDRPYVGIFTVIAYAWIGAITFGWRAIGAVLISRRQRRRPSPSAA